MKIGIPRALLYYRYHPLWCTFFHELGLEVVTSPPTTKSIFEKGVSLALSEVCLPVKIYMGHVEWLLREVDCLFVPRILSVENSPKRRYTCPKTMGLPDFVRASFDSLPLLIAPDVEVSKRPLRAAFHSAGSILGKNRKTISRAFELACQKQAEHEGGILKRCPFGDGNIPPSPGADEVVISLVGHPYILFDPHLNVGIVDKLKGLGATVVSQFSIPAKQMEDELERYEEISWTYEREIVGAISHYIYRNQVDGIIYLMSFPCGPGSVVGEIVVREVKRDSTVPLLILVLDEHTGDQGILTRIEAFADIIRVRKRAG